MSGRLPSKATFWGIREPELHILSTVTYWFNGRSLTIRDEERQIATHPELPLKEMLRGTTYNYDDHRAAHERLLANDILEEGYICRRKIDWIPTEQGIRAIRDCLEPWNEELRPEWADDSDDGPIFGDPNETLLHRKGVEIAGDMIPWMPWTTTGPHGEPHGVTWYPENSRGEPCHDLHIKTNERMTNLGVEVITANNNTDYLVNKWERYASEDRTTLWIFDNRDTACQLFNALDKRSRIYLDGGQFRNYSNWSASAINQKLWRSEENHSGGDISDLVHTVTGLLNGDRDKIQSLFEDYYSNK